MFNLVVNTPRRGVVQKGWSDPFDDIFDVFFSKPVAYEGVKPNMDLWEDKDNVYASIELPGVDRKDIKIEAENDILSISGKSENKQEDKSSTYYKVECYSGTFSRKIKLPAVIDNTKVKAKLINGILELILPKAESAKRKLIEIS